MTATDSSVPSATGATATGAFHRTLTESQLRDYQRNGFLVLKGRIPDTDIARIEEGFARNPPLDGTLDTSGATYPEPGRYTLAQNCLKDPDLAYLAEHPAIVPAAADILGGDPRLTAYVIYDRTPGGPSIGSHNDYKRWRPVGSSMNWAFTIVPFCDFDAAAGQLLVAPGSHRLDRVTVGPERPLCVAPPIKPEENDYVDPELERGDLLLMNMHLWHRANGNTSDHHRVGAFNKYAAANAPPATGYFLYDDDVHDALSPAGKSLLAVHSHKPIATTRLVLHRERDEPELFLADVDDETMLPGGPTFVEQAIPDWDRGNVIASLQASLREQLRIETPWASYLGDFDEGDHLCRVYGYTLTGLGFPVPYDQGRWLTRSQLESDRHEIGFGYELEALDRWLDPTIVRGKGLTQAQSRVNQYAY
ncbi:MAG: phytanoyl-CoA dioxygenase family protein [Acidimicrobiia bacterium]|nr:phytanoyl-CoA dioxygenase family protein [Acidimicrobiia bacterium]